MRSLAAVRPALWGLLDEAWPAIMFFVSSRPSMTAQDLDSTICTSGCVSIADAGAGMRRKNAILIRNMLYS
jgi:hypothetical protein